MTPKLMLHAKVTPAELLAEVLALRPEIERVLADQPGCTNASSIEDRVQIVLLNIVRHLDTYEPHVDGVRPWVWRIAHNVKLDAQRSRKRHIAAIGYERLNLHEIPSHDVCPERRTRARQLLRKVMPVIAEMPKPLRTVLVLVVFSRLNLNEVATALGIEYGNARTRLCRAHEYIRERFGSLNEHLAVLAPIPVFNETNTQSLPRRALILTGQFVHLWPPFLAGALALSQMEMPLTSETSTVAIIRNDVEQPQPVTEAVDVFRAKLSTSITHTPAPTNAKAPPQYRSSAKPKVGTTSSSRATFQESIAPADPLVGDGL